MKRNVTKFGVIAGAVGLVLAAGTAGGAVAGSLITSAQIQDQTIQSQDIAAGGVGGSEIRLGAVGWRAFNAWTKDHIESLAGQDGAQGPQGDKGDTGATGPAGQNAYQNAYYATAYYNAGDTNAGAIATVACNDPSDTAVSGGVQVLGLDADANSRNTPVSSSFPGRMDWTTNAPKPDRLDGWIVQFGGAAGQNPEKVKVWALCMPNTEVTVVQNYLEQPTS